MGDPSRLQHDDQALVRAAQADVAQFNALYHLYVERVHRYMLARTHNAEDAADLTQQVFLQALDALPRYRDRGVPFAAWVFRIAQCGGRCEAPARSCNNMGQSTVGRASDRRRRSGSSGAAHRVDRAPAGAAAAPGREQA